MNADDCNGRSHMSGSGGESATERDFDGGLKGPTVSTPNSQQSSPKRSLSANSIKVELYSDDESAGAPQRERRGGERDDRWKDDRGAIEEGSADQGGRVRGGTGSGYSELASPKPVSPDPIRLANGKLKCDICGMICIGPNVLMVHKRSHTGERPFQCNQCGASFTQKGNLLRHVKLHSGEKPFKCPFCSYACRRRDALSGHLRTHAVSSLTVGKPFKCSYCGRSYKQQSTLEEHCERCHSYLQSLDHQPALSTQTAQGEESRSLELMTEPILQPSTEKLTVMDRLANSITKRKRSTPQKFLGEKRMRLNLLDAPHELSSSSEKERDLYSSHPGGDPAGLVRMGGRYLQGSSAGGGDPEPPRPPLPQCIRMPEHTPVISSLYSHMAPLRPRANCGGGVAAMSAGLTGREADEGHEDVPSRHSHTASPSNGCHHDSTDTESTVEEQSTGAAAPTSNSNHHHPVSALPRGCPRSTHAKDREPEWEKACPVPVTPATVKGSHSGSPHSREAVQVVDGQGRAVRSYRCEHCGIFFLDHVMFTIHMGCHGFRQPFECNICGHLSQDHYEFSSHMTRGEHKVG